MLCISLVQLAIIMTVMSIFVGALFVGTTSMMDSNVPIFLSDLRCDSTIHDELVDCDSNSHGIPDRSCSHQLDVKIHCEGNYTQTQCKICKALLFQHIVHKK